MREITEIEEIKDIELSIMKAIHSFCTSNNIRYFLFYGSLLGAVRHNGFIPWDDDIDIAMPREDYTRFINEFHLEDYDVFSCETNELYPYPFAKAFDKRTKKVEPIYTSDGFEIGIDVDIFPIDNYKECEKKILIKRIISRKKLFNSFLDKPNVTNIKKFIRLVQFYCFRILKVNSNKYAIELNCSSEFEYTKDYMIYFNFYASKPMRIKEEWINELILHRFEDTVFYIPKGYDELLKVCYGDYMTLPPKEKRNTHHSNKMYWKE